MSESHRDEKEKRKSDFSIARILADDKIISCELISDGPIKPHEAADEGTGFIEEKSEEAEDADRITAELNAQSELQWLQCTRYRPPRLPRNSTGRNSKRRPATHPRIPFTTFQLDVLEDKYKSGPYLTRKDVVQLSGILRLPQSRVKIWFQNRRARDRRENKVSSSLAIA